MTMKASDILIEKLKALEGFSAKAYKCPSGVWTIGWGTTKGVHSGMTVTYAEAERMMKKDLATFELFVNKLGVAKTQGQFDALVDFAYNLGTTALGSSTLLKKIKAGVNSSTLDSDFQNVPMNRISETRSECAKLPREKKYEYIIKYQFSRWNKANGIILNGLVKRREWEAKRFFD